MPEENIFFGGGSEDALSGRPRETVCLINLHVKKKKKSVSVFTSWIRKASRRILKLHRLGDHLGSQCSADGAEARRGSPALPFTSVRRQEKKKMMRGHVAAADRDDQLESGR